MANNFDAKRVINGLWGSLYLDNEEIAEVISFQAKEEYQKEDVPQAGKMVKGKKIVGIDSKGSVSLHKVNSRLAKKINTLVRSGKTPSFTFTSMLKDPDAYGYERVAVKGVVFDDLTHADWEVGVLGKIEAPFTYQDLTYIDAI
jgi:hypothetical protein